MSFEQGVIVALSFDPTIGHEQAGYRPALVISKKLFNDMTKMIVVCPITSKVKQLPMRVPLDSRTKTQGFILCEQPRTVDCLARNPVFIERLPDDILEIIKQTVCAIFE